MQPVLDAIRKLSGFKTSVLIQGESGTGKELVARALHENSPRNDKQFVALNCGAIPEKLLESELFGHKKGAFTDARSDKLGLLSLANGGSVFLDEVGELPRALQVKLLRVLQESEMRAVGSSSNEKLDIRFIAASLKPLEEEVFAGTFREDLFYRLNVVTVHLPPLRQRHGDIAILVSNFIQKFNTKHKLEISGISPEALARLEKYQWPGNVRELEHVIEGMMVLSDDAVLQLDDIPSLREKSGGSASSASMLQVEALDDLSVKKHSSKLEKLLITEALERTGGNKTQAAKLLEISQRALLYKLKGYEIEYEK